MSSLDKVFCLKSEIVLVILGFSLLSLQWISPLPLGVSNNGSTRLPTLQAELLCDLSHLTLSTVLLIRQWLMPLPEGRSF